MDEEQATMKVRTIASLPWDGARPRHVHEPIRPIPCETAAFVVTIDGKPYAGFVTRACAEMAVLLWTGEIDGIGNPIPPSERGRRGWLAVRGKSLEIVERGSLDGSPPFPAARWS